MTLQHRFVLIALAVLTIAYPVTLYYAGYHAHATQSAQKPKGFIVRLYSGGQIIGQWETTRFQFGEDGAVSFRTRDDRLHCLAGTIAIEEVAVAPSHATQSAQNGSAQ